MLYDVIANDKTNNKLPCITVTNEYHCHGLDVRPIKHTPHYWES
jgi:hypothetical protein